MQKWREKAWWILLRDPRQGVTCPFPSKALLKHKTPGWNSSVNAVHRHSKAAWKLWKASGKPNCPTNPVRKSYLIFYGGATLVTHMTTLFNQIVEQEYIPQIFQHGLIIPIPKSYNKDPSDSSNYRGITLLSVIAKILRKSSFSAFRQLVSPTRYIHSKEVSNLV